MHEHIDPAPERRPRLLRQRLDRVGDGQVGPQQDVSVAAQRVQCLVRRRAVGAVMHGHAQAVGGQHLRDGASDAARSAGDKRGLSLTHPFGPRAMWTLCGLGSETLVRVTTASRGSVPKGTRKIAVRSAAAPGGSGLVACLPPSWSQPMGA